jgi:beta-phosphoglucomutase
LRGADKTVRFGDVTNGAYLLKGRGGMKCVAVRFVGHHPEDALRQAGADLVVSSLEEVSVQAIVDLVG